MHIIWSAYATPHALAAVIAFYEQAAGSLIVERNTHFKLRGPKDQLLEIRARNAFDLECGVKPASNDATIIVVSQAIRSHSE